LEFFKYIDESLNELEKLKQKLALAGEKNSVYNVLMPHKDGIFDYNMDFSEKEQYFSLFITIKKKIIDFITGDIGLYMMDLFLLRRFLDKDYVTNTITYTGAHHSINYIRLLVKYFDFDITHCSYIKNNDISSATTKIKKSKKNEELKELFFTPIFIQCSDLGSFPKLFE
jgi:hypothetical protein